MSTASVRLTAARVRCYWRPIILAIACLVLLGLFWFASRYPQLISKAEAAGQTLPSMAFSTELISVAADAPTWQRIVAATVNWLDNMKIGMTFGVLFGALLHTQLRYYPIKIGGNTYLNSFKGALAGVPVGVCVNCAVPAACGVTRGNGRVEVALGFLFSSPNFNPVVVVMTLAVLPASMVITKYGILLLVILVAVPSLVRWMERKKPLEIFTNSDGQTCALPLPAGDGCQETFTSVLRELSVVYSKHVWMLVKPTIAIMLIASVVSAILLTLVPWESLLVDKHPLTLGLVSLVSVFMPVPIALDVMFAAQLQQQGIAAGYVMMIAMTLGTYSIIPSIYLWREVSKRLSVILFLFFWLTGWGVALLF